MELFPAAEKHAWDYIAATIDDSDYYVVLLGSRYGSLCPGSNYSYTEREYRYALETGKPVAAFIQKLPPTTAQSDELRRFRSLIERKLVQFWETPEQLATKVATSLHQLIKDNPADGWVRPSRRTSKQPRRLLGGVTQKTLEGVIGNRPWITGAINFDEDLHFSSFYLRRSLRRWLPTSLKEFGYSKLIAVFDDLNEQYFIPADECREVAERLVQRILDDPTWFQKSILDEIHSRVRSLETVFRKVKNPEQFKRASTKHLVALYRSHKASHERLYEVARIPETLDRGVGYFTAYLKEIICKRADGVFNEEEQARAFDALTYAEAPSIYLQERNALQELAEEIHREIGPAAFRGTAKRVLMNLSSSAKSKIEAHQKKWWFWGYHGYGVRAQNEVEDYLERIGTVWTAESALTKTSRDDFRDAEKRRNALFVKLGVPPEEQQLFRFFPRIGIAKLERRYVQLKNFYYLDSLLAELASRLSASEAQLRSMLPEELLAIARPNGKRPLPPDLDKRSRYCVYVATDLTEYVLAGEEFTWVKTAVDASIRPAATIGPELRGSSLCSGVAKGLARVINRPDDAARSGFRPGDILVSQSADPDIAKWIETAGGVLVEQGGVTCHAAIICREFAKPGISAIPDLMQRVHNGDFVELDAFRGIVTVRASADIHLCSNSSNIDEDDFRTWGRKATTLAKMRRAGLSVPDFFAVPVAALGRELPPDARGVAQHAVGREIEELLKGLDGPVFIIRSSMVNEDIEGTAAAGQYLSEANVDRRDVLACVPAMVDRIVREYSATGGSLVIQEMILGDYSGTCFTQHPVNNSAIEVLIEAVPGGNAQLTDGSITPASYVFSRDTEQFTVSAGNHTRKDLLSREMLRRIVGECDKVASLFGGPQDIEWTVKEGVLWLLQSRPISRIGSARQGIERNHDHDVNHANDITEICRIYRVPPNLKLHLLRVAAVGDWICHHWRGPSINRTRIKMALLLHDIGNIVKADYERTPGLFPEELRNLRYWMAVQENVRRRFGDTDTAASAAIARDIGVPANVVQLMTDKQFVNNEETARSQNWDQKIAAYADQRVSPHGVTSLDARLWEAKERYRDVPTASVNMPTFEALVAAAKAIETQLSEWCDARLNDLNNEVIEPYIDALRSEKLF
jgi:phosphohistidine swiveling domain-containing protein